MSIKTQYWFATFHGNHGPDRSHDHTATGEAVPRQDRPPTQPTTPTGGGPKFDESRTDTTVSFAPEQLPTQFPGGVWQTTPDGANLIYVVPILDAQGQATGSVRIFEPTAVGANNEIRYTGRTTSAAFFEAEEVQPSGAPSGITPQQAQSLPGVVSTEQVGSEFIVHLNNGRAESYTVDPTTGLLVTPRNITSNPGPSAIPIGGPQAGVGPLASNQTPFGLSNDPLFNAQSLGGQLSAGLRLLPNNASPGGLDPLTQGQAIAAVRPRPGGVFTARDQFGNAVDPLAFTNTFLQGQQGLQLPGVESQTSQIIRLAGMRSTGDPLQDAVLAQQIMQARASNQDFQGRNVVPGGAPGSTMVQGGTQNLLLAAAMANANPPAPLPPPPAPIAPAPPAPPPSEAAVVFNSPSLENQQN